ncbi:hypothetical protein D3C76_1421640 [compost metagenome]
MHHHQKRRRLLLGGHALAAHIFRQTSLCLRHTVLYLDRGLVGISARTEGDGHLQHAVRASHRLEIHHAFDAIDRLFQRRGHGFSDHLGVGARIDGSYHYRRRHHFRILTHRQVRNGDQSGSEDHDRQHSRKNWPINKETGKVHGIGP